MCGAMSLLTALLAVPTLLAVLASLTAALGPLLRCLVPSCQHVDYSLYEVDGFNIEIYIYESSLSINCNGANVLESAAMPRVVSGRMSSVDLRGCPLPIGRSLADTLAAFNVTLMHNASLTSSESRQLTLENLPAVPLLAATHFAGLDHLDSLRLFGEYGQTWPQAERGFLAPLGGLRELTMFNVELSTDALEIPLSLKRIDLDVVGLERLPVVAALEYLSLSGWESPRPTPLANCDGLRELYLHRPKATVLPDGWLANCSRLELLRITAADVLTVLPSNLGNTNLKSLTIWQSALQSLPASLLDHSPNLRTLQFSATRLRTLPSGMFTVAQGVQNLDLSFNNLGGGAVEALKSLKELTELNLGQNPDIGDVCGTDGYSAIRNLMKLKKLLMGGTGVNRICRDWRHDMTALETLDLGRTRLTNLTLEDLQFTRTVKAEVVLTGTPVAVVEMTREDYNNAQRDLSKVVSIRMDAVLECDCRMYWTGRALSLPLPTLRHVVGELACAGGRRLRDVPPEELLCSRGQECAAAALPTACSCATRPDDDSRHDRLLVRVHCENGLLASVPRPRPHDPSTERLYELLLWNNNITELHADDLHDIRELDLRNNSLRRVDEATAMKLGGISGMLRLAGNPFECSCSAAPLLRALHARDPAYTDRDEATCSDGIALYAAPAADCLSGLSLVTWIAIALAVLLVIVVATTIFLASSERRYFAMAVLHRWGIVWRGAEPAGEAGRQYDVFLTFSHKDEDVVLEIMAHLEPNYRLCVHQRDWIPGRSIFQQIMESVRESRRTVALISKHFLASSWTRVEFREAHAAAMLEAWPRLVVVLLEDPAALHLDDELRRYIDTHTYVRWGESWFWDKLAVALPKPRAPPPIPRDPQLAPRANPIAPHDPPPAHLVPLLALPVPEAGHEIIEIDISTDAGMAAT